MNPDPLIDNIRKLKGPALPELLLEKTWGRIEADSEDAQRWKWALPCLGTLAAAVLVTAVLLLSQREKPALKDTESNLRGLSDLSYSGLRDGEGILRYPGKNAREIRLKFGQKLQNFKVVELNADFIVLEADDGRQIPYYLAVNTNSDLSERN